MDSAASNRFETEIARYNRWREELTQSVHAYHDWLESSGQLDVQQSIRFYDLLENLNKGRLMLAFLAEFSRGKSELINALFFSSFKERLLPSDVGRTTMCPTEIFHDPNEEPYLKLLSVETRYRDESITQLKNMPIEWSKIRLNTNSAADMKKSLKALADTKKVYALEARMLGLAPMVNEKGELPGEEELVEPDDRQHGDGAHAVEPWSLPEAELRRGGRRAASGIHLVKSRIRGTRFSGCRGYDWCRETMAASCSYLTHADIGI